MPSGNQNSPQGQGRQGAGAAQGAREQIQNLGQQVQERVAQAGQNLREGYDTTREEMARRYRRAEGMVARNPAPSVLVSFGIGFGLGLVLTTMLPRREETWSEKYLPDSIRNAPDSLQDLTESLRKLPDAIAGRISSALGR